MLTDIFADRYQDKILGTAFEERHRRFFVQMAKLITEQVYVRRSGGERRPADDSSLQSVHDKLAMELGLKELSLKFYFYGTPQVAGTYSINSIITNFLTFPFSENMDPDIFIARRLSLVEIAFRDRYQELEREGSRFIDMPAIAKGRGTLTDYLATMAQKAVKNAAEDLQIYKADVDELNARLLQGKLGLHFHNGFLQFSEDSLVATIVEKPFWDRVSGPDWANVDLDMKEAVDHRDTQGRDAAFFAFRALESAIKIVSDKKGWTTGQERGAAHFIDNLMRKENAFIEVWEGDVLKGLFSKIRNRFGHGPGSDPMPALSPAQTDWALETTMSWIKSLIGRL
jgi:hypothetical protein